MYIGVHIFIRYICIKKSTLFFFLNKILKRLQDHDIILKKTLLSHSSYFIINGHDDKNLLYIFVE